MVFKLRYLGLNSYEFVTEGGVRVVTDPTFSRPWKNTPVDRETYPPPDVIFLTHGDPSDHVYEVPRLMTKTDAICIASAVVCDYLASIGRGYRIRSDKLLPVEWGEEVTIRGVDFLITKALHIPLSYTIGIFTGEEREIDVDAPVESSEKALRIFMEEIPSYKDRIAAVKQVFGDNLPPRGPCIGFQLTSETGHTVWYSGSYLSTAHTQQLAKRIQPQIALVQILSGREEMAAHVAGTLRPGIAIPFHQDKNFDDQPGEEADLERFDREVKKISPLTQTAAPELGKWYDLGLSVVKSSG